MGGMDSLPDNDGQAKGRKLPEFLREDKPTGINRKQWKRLRRKSGLHKQKQRLLEEYTSGRRQWPQWAMIILNREDVPDVEMSRLIENLTNPKKFQVPDYDERQYQPPEIPSYFSKEWLRENRFEVVFASLALISVVCLWYYFMIHSLVQAGTPAAPGVRFHSDLPNNVILGVHFEWRQAGEWVLPPGTLLGKGGYPVVVTAVQADGDPDQELLVQHTGWCWKQSGDGEMEQVTTTVLDIYEADGTFTRIDRPGSPLARNAYPWDWDGDGICELAVADQARSAVEVFNLAGERLAELEGRLTDELWQGYPQPQSDIDGDGSDELWLLDPGSSAVTAYGTEGRVAWQSPVGLAVVASAHGDIDADGADEVIDLLGDPRRIYGPGYPVDGREGELRFAAGVKSDLGWAVCADLDRDGADEVIVPDYGYLDIAGQTITELDWLQVRNTIQSVHVNHLEFEYFTFHGLAVGDLMGDNARELALFINPDCNYFTPGTSFLCIFDRAGSLIHLEEIRSQIQDVAVAEFNGRDRLVVAANQHLYFYP